MNYENLKDSHIHLPKSHVEGNPRLLTGWR